MFANFTRFWQTLFYFYDRYIWWTPRLWKITYSYMNLSMKWLCIIYLLLNMLFISGKACSKIVFENVKDGLDFICDHLNLSTNRLYLIFEFHQHTLLCFKCYNIISIVDVTLIGFWASNLYMIFAGVTKFSLISSYFIYYVLKLWYILMI